MEKSKPLTIDDKKIIVVKYFGVKYIQKLSELCNIFFFKSVYLKQNAALKITVF